MGLGVNEAINALKKTGKEAIDILGDTRVFGGVHGSLANVLNKESKDGLWTSIKKAHLKAGSDKDYDLVKIAGSAFTVGAAGRIASGGGLYKDKNGNTNIIGVPFI